MKFRVLGAFGGEGLGHRPSAFLINDRTLIDAGTVSSALTVPEQLSIEYALISHSHLDHVAGLVYLSETLGFCETGAAVTVTGIDPVVSTLRWSVFNNILWPDFSKIPHADVPVVKYRALVEDVEQRVADLWVTPVHVNHRADYGVHHPRRLVGPHLLGGHGPDRRALACGPRAPRSRRRDPRVRLPEPAGPARGDRQAPHAHPDQPRARQASARPPRPDLTREAPVPRGDRRGARAHRQRPRQHPGAGQDVRGVTDRQDSRLLKKRMTTALLFSTRSSGGPAGDPR